MKAMTVTSSKGFSLIELMIAMTLGLIIVAAVSSVFVSSSGTFRKNRIYAELLDSGYFASWFLRTEIQNAGWTEGVELATSAPINFSSACAGGFCTDDGATSDSISIEFEALTDCLGSAVNGGSAGVVRNRYYVNNQQLLCDGNASEPQVIADNIAALEFQYGVDTNDDLIIDQYLSATQVRALGLRRVMAVHFELLATGSENSLPAALSKQSFTLLGRTYSFDDLLARRKFGFSVPLQNQNVTQL